MSMEDLKKQNDEIKGKIEGAVEKAQDMSDEAREAKEKLGDMPGGLDDDIMEAINSATESITNEAKADIQSVKDSALSEAKAQADRLVGDINKKISDNDTAKGKLDSISSKYGKGDISKAISSIDANTKAGEDIIDEANKASESGSQKLDQLLQGV